MQHCNKIAPKHCSNMRESRAETSVRAPARFDSMLQQRRGWALATGLNSGAIENVSRFSQPLY